MNEFEQGSNGGKNPHYQVKNIYTQKSQNTKTQERTAIYNASLGYTIKHSTTLWSPPGFLLFRQTSPLPTIVDAILVVMFVCFLSAAEFWLKSCDWSRMNRLLMSKLSIPTRHIHFEFPPVAVGSLFG
jgi:hypothetical protein